MDTFYGWSAVAEEWARRPSAPWGTPLRRRSMHVVRSTRRWLGRFVPTVLPVPGHPDGIRLAPAPRWSDGTRHRDGGLEDEAVGRSARARRPEREAGRDHRRCARRKRHGPGARPASVRQAPVGCVRPGARLRQEELADVFGTSRIPVREALRALEYEGLVDLRAAPRLHGDARSMLTTSKRSTTCGSCSRAGGPAGPATPDRRGPRGARGPVPARCRTRQPGRPAGRPRAVLHPALLGHRPAAPRRADPAAPPGGRPRAALGRRSSTRARSTSNSSRRSGSAMPIGPWPTCPGTTGASRS